MKNIAINGFGRIGRLVFRAMINDPEINIVAINGSGDIETMVHLVKYDSIHRRCFDTISAKDDETFVVNGKTIKRFNVRDPHDVSWADIGADIIIEATGAFREKERAQRHLDSGAKKVLITAPGKNEDITIVMGVNDEKYDPEIHHIVSCASCTTNCLAPITKVLSDTFGFVQGFLTTTHSYTNDQVVLDSPHKDLRRARAAALSIIPTTTGAARAISRVLPEMQDKMDGIAFRVPTADGSLIDLTAILETEVTPEQINATMKEAAFGRMKGILYYTEDPIVQQDIIDNPHSSIFDTLQTMVMPAGKSNMVRCVSWYDNEWGYSNRVVDLAKILLP